MKYPVVFICAILSSLFLLTLRCKAADTGADAPRPVNVVIMLADDLGYGDLGCYGHPTIRTPHLDEMASQGMRFTDFYACAVVCTPSRAGLLTGRYPLRTGMTDDKRRVLFPNSTGGLPPEEITIAAALKTRGYATACIGKWHLGHLPKYMPTSHGFDFYFGLPYSNDMDMRVDAPKGAVRDPDAKTEWFNVPLIQGSEIIERPADQHTLTKRYTEQAIGFIHDHKEQPFFVYLAHTFPHVPLFASEKFAHSSPRGLYGDVVEEIDWSAGQIMEELQRDSLAENTLVIFTSDNGPWLIQENAGGSAGMLRDGKGSTWEGGMRVPCIAWWPGTIKPGQTAHDIACNMDLFNTALAVAGVPLPADRPIDGVSLLPVLLNTGPTERNLFFYYRDTKLFAVRKGPYKAHYVTQTGYGPAKPEVHNPPLLFDLEQDPAERFDISADHPNVIADIAKEVERHQANMVPGKDQLAEVENPQPGK